MKYLASIFTILLIIFVILLMFMCLELCWISKSLSIVKETVLEIYSRQETIIDSSGMIALEVEKWRKSAIGVSWEMDALIEALRNEGLDWVRVKDEKVLHDAKELLRIMKEME